MALTGPSGSGKTTLLNIIAMLDRPSGGNIFFQDKPMRFDSASIREWRTKRVGMVFQQFCLLPRRTTLENVLFRFRYTEPYKPAMREQALKLLTRLGLEHVMHQPTRLLSGGEMQRVAIARAMVSNPPLLVADEPTGNLDAQASQRVMEELQRLNQEGTTILLVTHDETLLPFSNRHYRCRDGMLEEETI